MAPLYQAGPRPTASSARATSSGSNNKQAAVNQWSNAFPQATRRNTPPFMSGGFSTPPVFKPTHDAENPKTPGHNPQSAHHSKKFGCTFNGCGRRFDTQKALHIHKEAEHDYCRVCDLDFEDDDKLHLHKMQSERHVVCNICGVEFQSEPGRDRHAKQMHAAQQNIKCRGCNKVFAKGSGLLLHFEQNNCEPLQSIYMADHQVHGREMLESNRALLAMQMEQLQKEEAEKKAAARSAMSNLGTSIADETDGGVRLQPSLLDDDLDLVPSEVGFGTRAEDEGRVNEFENLIELASMQSYPKGHLQAPLVPSNVQSSAASIASRTTNATAKAWSGDHPALKPQNVGSQELEKDIDALSISSSVNRPKAAWGGASSKKLFPDAEPTPVPADMDVGYLKGIKVGEDAAEARGMGPGTLMTADPIDNKFHCPFPTCEKTAEDIYKMIEHMKTHSVNDNRCSGCLRVFGSTSALVAHMESPSTRCNIRKTKGFSNAIHIVSGGFLGAYGRLEDGTVKLDSQKKPESFW